MIVRQLLTKWGVEVDDRQLKTLNRKIDVAKKRFDEAGKTAKKFGKTSTLFVTAPIAVLGAGFIKAASDMEAIQTQFEVLTHNADTAKSTIKELQDFSAKTPFQFKDIARAGQQLLGFQFKAKELPTLLQQVGDVASASGSSLGEVALIFGQVSAAGKLTGERLLQLQERAIPIGPALAKTMGVAETQIRDLVSKGQVDFKTFQRAFASLSAEGGAAFGGMAKQSETFAGRLSTLKDNVTLLAMDFGNELLPVAKDFLEILLKIVQAFRKMSPWMKKIILVVGGLAAAIGPLLIGIGFMSQGLVGIISAAKILIPLIQGLKFASLGLAAVWAAAFVGVFLVLEDILAFAQGRKSVLGLLVQKFSEGLDMISEKFKDLGPIVMSALAFILTPIRGIINGIQAIGGALGAIMGGDIGLAGEAITNAIKQTVAPNIGDFGSLIGFGKEDRQMMNPTPQMAQGGNTNQTIAVNTNVSVPPGTPPHMVADEVNKTVKRSMDEMLRQTRETTVPQVEY